MQIAALPPMPTPTPTYCHDCDPNAWNFGDLRWALVIDLVAVLVLIAVVIGGLIWWHRRRRA